MYLLIICHALRATWVKVQKSVILLPTWDNRLIYTGYSVSYIPTLFTGIPLVDHFLGGSDTNQKKLQESSSILYKVSGFLQKKDSMQCGFYLCALCVCVC